MTTVHTAAEGTEPFAWAGERFADIQMLRYRLAGFTELTPRQRVFIYYLSRAALAGRDITTDQHGRHNLAARRLLEAVHRHWRGDRACDDFTAFERYLKQVWFASGLHHHYSMDKFRPGMSEQWLRAAVEQVADYVDPRPHSTVDEMWRELRPAIFDPDVEAKRVCQDAGRDLVLASACNFYGPGVTQAEAERHYAAIRAAHPGDEQPSWGLNSRLVRRADGTLAEQTYRVGGLYGRAIAQVCHWLETARPYASGPGQQRVIDLLVDYYRTGDLATFDRFSIAWLEEREGPVDFINGFIEVYGDPLGLKGTWEGFVSYRDAEATRRTEAVAREAQWFEDHSPVDPRFRKPRVRGVTAAVVTAAMLGGDEYPASAIGINLPNADWIRARHGSKSVTISNLTEAYDQAARGGGLLAEFAIDDDTRLLIERHGDLCDNLHTDLHECLGHGSGRLLPGVDPDALGQWASTIEEARADLFGLYFIADPKLVEMGLLPDTEAHHAQYYHYLMNGLLTQLARIEPGRSIEEAHMRNRALICRWTLAHADGAAALVVRGGKTYVAVRDYAALRGLFARLLAEVQRIKSTGDRAAAQRLVEQYGVAVDPALHAEVRRRYDALGLAPYKGFINPRLTPVIGPDGEVADVRADYTEGYAEQMLRYSAEYATL